MNPRVALTALGVFACCAFTLTAGGQPYTVDEWLLFDQTTSLVERGELDVPQAVTAGHFYGRTGLDGRAYAPYGPGWSILAAPILILSRAGSDRDSAAGKAIQHFAATTTNTLAAALAVVLVAALALRLGATLRTSIALALAAGFTTPIWAYSGTLYTESVSTALFALTIWLATSPRTTPRALAGLPLGVAVLVKLSHAALVPVPLLVVGWLAGRRRDAAWMLLPVLGALAVHAFLGESRFGSPFATGYPAAWDGKALNGFDTSIATGLFGLLVSPGKGLFLFAPAVLLAIPFWPRLNRRDPVLAVAAGGLVLSALALYATYSQWEGGFCLGPRYLVPMVPLAILPLALWEGRWTRFAPVLLVAGVLLQVPAATTNWFADEADRAAYYAPGFVYRIDDAPLPRLAARFTTGLRALVVEGPAAPEVRGLDHWMLHLGRAGVPIGGRVALAILLVLGAVGSAMFLWKASRAATPDA